MSLSFLQARKALLIAFTAVAVTLGVVFAVPSFGARADADISDLHQVFVTHHGYRIAVQEQKGAGPAIVLLHGFPDNHHLYDKVVSRLKGRNVVTFDFLGWGASDKPSNYNYTFAEQEGDLDAVITQLHLGPVILVASDSGVPTAINWSLDNPGRTQRLVVDNGFYGPVDKSGPPALTTTLILGQYPQSAPLGPLPSGTAFGLNSLVKAYSTQPGLFATVFRWEESTFFERPQDAGVFTPLFAHQFDSTPSSIRPMTSLAAGVGNAVRADGQRVPQLAKLGPITRLVWGAQDPDLNLNIANELHSAFTGSTLTVLSQAHHNVAIDAPGQVASAILGS